MIKKIQILVLIFILTSCTTQNKDIKPSEIQSHEKITPPKLVNDLWLEEIESEKALSWVQTQNKISLKRLQSDKRYPAIYKSVKDILESPDKIPNVRLSEHWVYNFWQDSKSVRGVWRRTTLDDYQKTNPNWRVLIDLDKLSKLENQNWVWKGTNCLRDESRCLIRLSNGGKDAVVVREFDLLKQKFVTDGFYVPEAKTQVDWITKDAVVIGTDWGKDSLTTSGYARQVRVLFRNQKLDSAKILFEGKQSDVSVNGNYSETPDGDYFIINRSVSFYENEYYLVNFEKSKLNIMPDDLSFQLTKIEIPASAEIWEFFKGRLIINLRNDWISASRKYLAGSVLSLPIEKVAQSELIDSAEPVFEPGGGLFLESLSVTKEGILLTALKDVKSELYVYKYQNPGWKMELVMLPNFGSVSISATNAFKSEAVLSYENFLAPTSLYLYDSSKNQVPVAAASLKTSNPKKIKSLANKFESSNLKVSQKFAISKDGTRVPYFLISPLSQNEPLPTVLYGYGGFEISETPYYLGARGKAWLESGNRAFAVANIRGGGEYGPAWHQAALKENRQKSFDDFIAVSEHLISTNVTTPSQLGIEGGSNGGLLVAAVFTQRPDLFAAVNSNVPLTDMLRFHKLLAGASWQAEYGEPEKDSDREFLSKYSPYQNVSSTKKYPEAFFMTSTKDDRVHPGHARRMVYKLLENNHPVLYYENTEGGHSAAANIKQRAKLTALKTIYFLQKLEGDSADKIKKTQ